MASNRNYLLLAALVLLASAYAAHCCGEADHPDSCVEELYLKANPNKPATIPKNFKFDLTV